MIVLQMLIKLHYLIIRIRRDLFLHKVSSTPARSPKYYLYFDTIDSGAGDGILLYVSLRFDYWDLISS